MAKQSLQQNLSQKLVPRQIQLMKLIQLPQMDLESRIREEMEENPALELVSDSSQSEDTDYDEIDMNDVTLEDNTNDEIDYEEYSQSSSEYNPDDEQDNFGYQLSTKKTFIELLQEQLVADEYNDEEQLILQYLIGSINDEGYLELSTEEISDEIAFKEGVYVQANDINRMLKVIQSLDPIGVGARNLQESLKIQLESIVDQNSMQKMALDIINNNYEYLTHRNYDQLKNHYNIDDEKLKEILQIITQLNPKPGLTANVESLASENAIIIPDFIAQNIDGKIKIFLINEKNNKVRVSSEFEKMLEQVDNLTHTKKDANKTKSFIAKNIDNAKWFIDALEMRKHTLITTMQAIADKQEEYLLSGDISRIKPLKLKTIADEVQMDISTISRVVNSKYVQTEFGILPLKQFFSDYVVNVDGEEVSVTKIKSLMVKIIEGEDKSAPYKDDEITEILNNYGFTLSRRTIAKYRDLLQIPIASLRKELK